MQSIKKQVKSRVKQSKPSNEVQDFAIDNSLVSEEHYNDTQNVMWIQFLRNMSHHIIQTFVKSTKEKHQTKNNEIVTGIESLNEQFKLINEYEIRKWIQNPQPFQVRMQVRLSQTHKRDQGIKSRYIMLLRSQEQAIIRLCQIQIIKETQQSSSQKKIYRSYYSVHFQVPRTLVNNKLQ